MMKKLILILSLLLLPTVALAEPSQQMQTQKVSDTAAVISVQKQPTQESTSQTQEIKNIKWSIIIQVQGKTPFDNSKTTSK